MKVKYFKTWTFQAAVPFKFQIISEANRNFNVCIVNGEEKFHSIICLGIERATAYKYIFNSSFLTLKKTHPKTDMLAKTRSEFPVGIMSNSKSECWERRMGLY